jgi:hypothetical protein
MWNPLRWPFLRRWRWRGFDPVPTDDDASRWTVERSRFWRELRAGQREAEANTAASLTTPAVRKG